MKKVDRWLFLVQRSAPFSPAMTDLRIRLQPETCKDMFKTCEHDILYMVVLRRAPSKNLNLQAGAKIQLVPDQWVAFGSRCTPMCVGASVQKTAHYVCQPLCRWRRCCLRFWPLSLFHQRRRELQSCRAMAPFWTFCICAICHCLF